MKRLPNYSLLWVSFIVFLCTGCNPASQLSVSSPDGNLCLHVETENGKLYYELSRNGKPILDKSRLGFILKEDTLAGHLDNRSSSSFIQRNMGTNLGRRPDCGKQLS